MAKIEKFKFDFEGKEILLILEFQPDKYGEDEFKRDVRNYIRRNKILRKVAYPDFDYFVKTASETIRGVLPQVLNKVHHVIQGEPFVIEFRIHDAEEDSYHSAHDEKTSRFDHMYIDLNGKSLTDIFVAPFYFRRISPVKMPDIQLKLIVDLVGLFQFHASLPAYKYASQLKKKVMKKYGLKDEEVDKLEYPALIPLFEILSDLRIEGLADFLRKTGQRLEIDLGRIKRFKKKLNKMVEEMKTEIPLQQIEKIYEDEYYVEDIETVGRYMCYFIALSLARHMGEKGIRVDNRYTSFEEIHKALKSECEIDRLPPKVCEETIKLLNRIEPKNHHSRFIYLYTRACHELDIPNPFVVLSYEDYVELKKKAAKYCEEEWKHWAKHAGFAVEHKSFGEMLREHFGHTIL